MHHCNSWRMKDQLDVTCTCASACKTNTTQNQPHQISNTQRTDNKTTDMVIQQHSRKLLMMDILMSETCWTRKKWNKRASDIKLVFHPSAVIIKIAVGIDFKLKVQCSSFTSIYHISFTLCIPSFYRIDCWEKLHWRCKIPCSSL